MSTKIASLTATIGADISGFEAGAKKVKTGLNEEAAAFARFDAEATRNAKSILAYEAQKAKAIAATEREAAKAAKQEEQAAKAAAKFAEQQRKASLSIAPGIEKGTKGIQEFAQANAGLISVATGVASAILAIGVAANKTIDQVVEYGDQVQKLKIITGQTAEATSNTIQLADDARVSYEGLTIALQFASKNGINTNLEGLAKLSEQYKALAPGIQRTEFLTKTFGKSGVEMGKILEMDSNAIKNFKAQAGQILTEKDLSNIKEYNHSLDGLKDRLQSTGNEIGKSLLPIKTVIADVASGYIDAIGNFVKKPLPKQNVIEFLKSLMDAKHGLEADKAAFLATGDAADTMADDLDNTDNALLSMKDLTKALSSEFSGLLSSMSSIQKSNDDYKKATEDIAKSDKELADKKQNLTYEWYKQVQAGKDTTETYKEYMTALSDISKAEADNADKKQQLNEDVSKATQQRKYDLVEQKLAVDGVSTKEFDYLENLKVNYGLVSRAAADQAIAENQAADALVAGFEQTLPPMERSLQIMQQIAAFNGTKVNFGVNFTSNMPNSSNSYSSPYSGTGYYNNKGTGASASKRDSGGSGVAGTPYMIGTGAQPEVFVPNTNGTFIPNADKKGWGGANYNIVINNPKKETAENSIRSSLKKLSYVGAAA